MRFSVWNQAMGAFDYYEGGGDQRKLNVEKPKHIRQRALGSTVEQAAWPLPAGARKIGSGPDAIGKVAVAKIGASGNLFGSLGLGDLLGDNVDLFRAALLAGAGFLLWKYAGKPARRRSRRSS